MHTNEDTYEVPQRRRFIDALQNERCQWTIKCRDGSEAQCGRRHIDGALCRQHAKLDTGFKATHPHPRSEP